MPKKEVAAKEETAVVNWEDQLAQDAKAIAKTERPSINRINFKSGVMTYMDNAMPDNEHDCIIVSHVQEHVFYREKYKAGEVKPPACFALSPPGDRMRPHENVEDPPGATCDECPMFKWGSDLEGGRGKACSERRRLAVIPVPESEADAKDGEMAIMSIPVMSVKNWANYVNKLAAVMQRPPWGVITKVKLVPDARSQFKVVFDLVGALDSEYLPHVQSRIQVAQSALMTPYEMNPESEEAEGDNKDTKY